MCMFLVLFGRISSYKWHVGVGLVDDQQQESLWEAAMQTIWHHTTSAAQGQWPHAALILL